ncbi:hypothetical protein Tco_0399164, partial [Tanacetum coccineum]
MFVTTPAVPATEDSPAVPEQTTVETTAQEMWEAIERLQQGESLNIQDVKTNYQKQFNSCNDASQCSISSTTSTRM